MCSHLQQRACLAECGGRWSGSQDFINQATCREWPRTEDLQASSTPESPWMQKSEGFPQIRRIRRDSELKGRSRRDGRLVRTRRRDGDQRRPSLPVSEADDSSGTLQVQELSDAAGHMLVAAGPLAGVVQDGATRCVPCPDTSSCPHCQPSRND